MWKKNWLDVENFGYISDLDAVSAVFFVISIFVVNNDDACVTHCPTAKTFSKCGVTGNVIVVWCVSITIPF